MTVKTTPALAIASITANSGAIVRHGPSETDREFLCMATRLETGIWASVWDQGAYGGNVYGRFTGTRQVIDLHLHTLEADPETRRELPIKWASRTVIEPIMLLGVPGDMGVSPSFAPASDMVIPEHQHVHQPVFRFGANGTPHPRGRLDTSNQLTGGDCWLHDVPKLQHYRAGGDKTTICVEAGMTSVSDIYLGGPVVDDAGRIAGVIIGAGLGAGYDHMGTYVPVDFLAPALGVVKATLQTALTTGRHSMPFNFVEHQSNDVDWREAPVPWPSAHRRDQMIQAVLPRRMWNRILQAASMGAAQRPVPFDEEEPAKQVETEAAVRALQEVVGD